MRNNKNNSTGMPEADSEMDENSNIYESNYGPNLLKIQMD